MPQDLNVSWATDSAVVGIGSDASRFPMQDSLDTGSPLPADIDALRKRVAELEVALAAAKDRAECRDDALARGSANDSVEDKLTASNARYWQMFETNQAVKLIIDPSDGQIVEANAAARDYYGYDDLTSMNISEINSLTKAEVAHAMLRTEREEQLVHSFQHRLASGEIRDVEVYSGPLKDGGKAWLYSIVIDVTERTRAQTLEADQRRLLELVSRGSATQVELLESITRIAERHLPGVRSSILLLEGDRIRPGAAPSMPAEYGALLDGLEIGPAVGCCGTAMYLKRPMIVEDVEADPLWANYRNLGTKYGFRACWSNPILDSHGLVLGAFAIYRDRVCGPTKEEMHLIESMTSLAALAIEKDRGEIKLRKLSSAIDQNSAAVIIADSKGLIEYVNSGFTTITGYQPHEVIGKSPRILRSEFDSDATYDEIRRTILAGEQWRGLLRNKKKNGELYWEDGTISGVVDEIGRVSHLVSVREDVSKHKALQAEKDELERSLRRAQKLETIGTLAGGIAHDFNNILTPIMGSAELAKRRIEPNNPALDDLDRILRASHRAKELVSRILLFCSQAERERSPGKIQLIAEEALHLLRPTTHATISIEENFDSTCAWILLDETQIHEVVVNLCTNAFQAMEGIGGSLTVAVQQLTVGEELIQTHPQLQRGEHVCLSVRDTGCGMDAETMDRAFEPFFTTRITAGGSGMGLSVVHGIARSHGGEVVVQSVPGEGSEFRVYFPVFELPSSAASLISSESGESEESILIVDDNVEVAQVVAAMVERMGYRVSSLCSSADALVELTERPEQYDLVISDLTMPELTGEELMTQLELAGIAVPFLIMTGYGESIEPGSGPTPRMISKPVGMEELSLVIREVLTNSQELRI